MAKKRDTKIGKILRWMLAAFMFSSCLAYGFCFTSVIFALLGLHFAPLAPIRIFIDQIMPKKKVLRVAIVFAIFVIGCCLAPQTEMDPQDIISTDTAISSDATTFSETSATIENATESTEEFATVTETVPVTESTTESTTEQTTAPSESIENSAFEVHFIDVGQADSALVLCDGKAMLIDGGNAEDSSLLYTYLKNHSINHLDYVIGTHAHEDHIGGLAGALNYASVDVAYCPVVSYDTKAFGNFVKALDKHGISITVPSRGDKFTLGSAECTILAVNSDSSDPNNSSIILRIVYGDTSFVFAADAEREVEQEILARYTELSSTVLKIGHHGSDTSTSYVWLREIMPQFAVISVGKDNSYGHPTENVLSRLRDAEVTTFRTDLHGDIICISDGTTVTFTIERNPDADVFGEIGDNSTKESVPMQTDPVSPREEEDNGQDYVVNRNTKKFHHPYCSSADDIKESNRWDYHGTRQELIDLGYVPCKRCNP